ncbi:MAG: hypothetical protein PVH05_12910, partial [Burkholderiales bacterium]
SHDALLPEHDSRKARGAVNTISIDEPNNTAEACSGRNPEGWHEFSPPALLLAPCLDRPNGVAHV